MSHRRLIQSAEFYTFVAGSVELQRLLGCEHLFERSPKVECCRMEIIAEDGEQLRVIMETATVGQPQKNQG